MYIPYEILNGTISGHAHIFYMFYHFKSYTFCSFKKAARVDLQLPTFYVIWSLVESVASYLTNSYGCIDHHQCNYIYLYISNYIYLYVWRYCIFSKFLKKNMYPNSYISALVIDISDDLFSTEFQMSFFRNRILYIV